MVKQGLEPGSPTAPLETESHTREIQTALRGRCHQETPENKGPFPFLSLAASACLLPWACPGLRLQWTLLSVVTCLWGWGQRGWAQSPTQAALCVCNRSRPASSMLGSRQLGDAETQVPHCQCPGCRGRPRSRRAGCQTPQPDGNCEPRGGLAQGTLSSGLLGSPQKRAGGDSSLGCWRISS